MTTPAHVDLPLRGLAGMDIESALEAWLLGLPGVLSVELRTTEYVVHVGYDDTRVAPPAIRDRLRAFSGAGQRGVSPHATQDASPATADPPRGRQ